MSDDKIVDLFTPRVGEEQLNPELKASAAEAARKILRFIESVSYIGNKHAENIAAQHWSGHSLTELCQLVIVANQMSPRPAQMAPARYKVLAEMVLKGVQGSNLEALRDSYGGLVDVVREALGGAILASIEEINEERLSGSAAPGTRSENPNPPPMPADRAGARVLDFKPRERK